jgi:hypothetical protein
MPVDSGRIRILVKAPGNLGGARLSLGPSTLHFVASPLFSSIGRSGGLGAAADGAANWHILSLDAKDANLSPWDLCHAFLTQGFGVAGAPSARFIEPDLPQQWVVEHDAKSALGLGADCGAPDGQDKRFPRPKGQDKDPLWHRTANASDFDAIKLPAPQGPRVRIAHFDTGFDPNPNHVGRPKFLRTDLGKNFVDPAFPNDATDRSTGLINNRGHGTGTLSILAAPSLGGSVFGGAPFAEIVPVRVADQVELFYNSAISQAFDYAHWLTTQTKNPIHVVTMSMGGLASQVWAEAVNAVYEAGIFVVTAAGNNFGQFPTRNIVYPARFNRVVAACGVMADHKPYADLWPTLMAGNYGPLDKMGTAIAAATPNVPWARFGCPKIIDLNGAGTSAATPQVAAAAANWIQKNMAALEKYPFPWMRVEAVRRALFEGAQRHNDDVLHFGTGQLRAAQACAIAPVATQSLKKQAPDTADNPLLNTLLGANFGIAPSRQMAMLQLEALQLSQRKEVENAIHEAENASSGKPWEEVVHDALQANPGLSVDEALRQARESAASPSGATLGRVRDALLAQPDMSKALRAQLGAPSTPARAPIKSGTAPQERPVMDPSIQEMLIERAKNPEPPAPLRRNLRVFAYDPTLAATLDTADINTALADVRWEKDLKPGPVGEYVEVVDVDPASGCCYAPVDLDHRHILASDGLAPSEGNPQFHQQMCYAIAMRTIECFENALGRRALWAPRFLKVRKPDATEDDAYKIEEDYVPRLRIYPHALRQKNAFYSPPTKSLMLGYFESLDKGTGTVLPGSTVFCAVSHDIIAHETTHALLDGLHRRYHLWGNPDMPAFHEAFADIVALFQHFTFPEALKHQIRKTRGDLFQQNLLGELAVQFGQAAYGGYGALRSAIGGFQPADGCASGEKWAPAVAKTSDYDPGKEAHDLGSVLVSAVFAAFSSIYQARVADLVRLATGGTGVLPAGAISNDLADRMAEEASMTARQILGMCIRALDYCPPTDLTFSDYLRALITADYDIVPNDARHYRVAVIQAFRERGIFPRDVRQMSVEGLLWEKPPEEEIGELKPIIQKLELSWDLDIDRRKAFDQSRDNGWRFHQWLVDPARRDRNGTNKTIAALGLIDPGPAKRAPRTIGGIEGQINRIEVHSVRPARRVGPDGNVRKDLIVEITQKFVPNNGGQAFYGGCTLVIDMYLEEVRYMVRKKLDSPGRLQDNLSFLNGLAAKAGAGSLRSNYGILSGATREPFALLHDQYNG